MPDLFSQDLHQISDQEAEVLCQELRRSLLTSVSQTGGHLASNLGAVELTVAIHRVYDTAKDRLVFDVGHQCYCHKILTGRAERMTTLRKMGGLSGFPKPEESDHDAFIAGHASNSVSVAVGMAKLSCDCRMANYTAILRKALDSAGFENVPILTTDPGDTKGIHPGVSMLGARSVLLAAWAFSMLDILEELCRKIRPYETAAGETNRVFSECVEWIAAASKQGLGKMIGAFRRAIEAFRGLRYDRSRRKPRVLVTGELLVNFHPGTNFHVEEYLERNDMEVILPRITYQFRKDFQAAISEIRDFGAHLAPYPFALDGAVEFIQRFLERIARSHPLYHPAARPQDLYSDVEHFIPKTLTCGEGWLMAGEIAHYAHQGVRSFIILQPFGCLPNHVCGRGVTKRLKEEFPGVQILPLDLDPDTSYANVENRLQMLIMNQTAEAEHSAASVEPAPQKTRGGSPRPALSST